MSGAKSAANGVEVAASAATLGVMGQPAGRSAIAVTHGAKFGMKPSTDVTLQAIERECVCVQLVWQSDWQAR